MIYAEPENARGRSFHGLLAYVLHDHGSSTTAERVTLLHTVNLLSPTIKAAADEMRASATMALMGRRRGQKPDRMAFHFILSWHPDDKPTPDHMAETALDALAALGLSDHQAVIVGHGDTDAPHVHVIASTIHPETLKAAKLGWRLRTMSRWAQRYEIDHGVIRCPKRSKAREKDKSRKRLRRSEFEASQGGQLPSGLVLVGREQGGRPEPRAA